MECLDWSWGLDSKIPDIGDLRKKARGLLKEILQKDYKMIGTGGFRVQKEVFYDEETGKDDIRLTLMFIVTDWDVESWEILEEEDRKIRNKIESIR